MNSWNNPMMNMNMGMNINPSPAVAAPPYQAHPVYTATPIHGQNAAQAFPMGPNSEIYLPDADQDIIWWIRTDNNNYRTVQAFDVKLHKEPNPLEDLMARMDALEEKVNAKFNKSAQKRNSEPTVDQSKLVN